MNTMKILIGRELDSGFNSWGIYIGYVVYFCICGFYSWLSKDNLFYLGQANMMPVFKVLNWTQFFLIPALTMRSFADEKRNGLLELILTQPVRTGELVRSKFLSCLVFAVLALVLTLPYYLTLTFLGEVDHGTVLLGYLGLVGMAACHISIGIFASSLSATPVSAFFIHVGIGLCFQLLFELLAGQMPIGLLANVFAYLSMNEHFDTISRGILDSRDILYFTSICVTFLALSKFSINKNRY